MKEQHYARRITVLNAVPDERFGGPQHRVLQVARRLEGKGVDTIVIMPRGDRTFSDMLDVAGISFFQLRSFRRLPNLSNIMGILVWAIFFIPCVITIRRLIRKHNVDIVHVNGALNIQVSLAARLAGTRLLWHLNDVRQSLLVRPVRLLLKVFPHKIVGASLAVEKNYFGKNSLRKMIILYPPVDTESFMPNDEMTQEYRMGLGIGEEEKVVGIVGNLNPFKGHEYFLESARLLKQQFPHIRFLMVGKSLDTHQRYWHRIRSLIDQLQLTSDVIVTGHRTDICGMINAMDVFVLTSLYEAAPIVILEAMACGKPVVATGVGGVPELVSENETSLLVEAKSPQSIAKAVAKLLNDPEHAREMGQNGRQRAVALFDTEICSDRHYEVYRSML